MLPARPIGQTATEIITWGGNRYLVEALVQADARFMVVGGTALRFYVPERPIGNNDLDLLVEATPTNAERIISALASVRLSPEFTRDRLAQQQRSQVQLKMGSFFADLVTDPKLPFNEHLATAHNASLFGCKVKVAGPK